jgi:hypothetical protein
MIVRRSGPSKEVQESVEDTDGYGGVVYERSNMDPCENAVMKWWGWWIVGFGFEQGYNSEVGSQCMLCESLRNASKLVARTSISERRVVSYGGDWIQRRQL